MNHEQLLTLAQEQQTQIGELLKKVICSSKKQKELQTFGKTRVAELLGNKGTSQYMAHARSTINTLWIDYRHFFKVRSYRDTPEAHFDSGVDYINNWHYLKRVGLPEPHTCLICEQPAEIETEPNCFLCNSCDSTLNGMVAGKTCCYCEKAEGTLHLEDGRGICDHCAQVISDMAP